jgi:hypothetical protein
MARAIAARCCCREWLRRNVLHARGETHSLERRKDAPLALRARHAPVVQRRFDVVVDVEIWNEIEALEDEPDLLVADARALVVGELAHVLAVEDVAPAVELFQQAGDVQERGLAGARVARDGDELPGFHFQAEVA